ncbi:MAG TPA: DUF2059 domain-containing protein, partial [Burkholderiaceae bacterium]|nr:DUF2059 domain-containing protein [Burkholderiaceae bacterium]
AEKFTEEELRQIIAMLDSPVRHKFEALVPEMEKALGEKIAAETRAAVASRLSELNQRINGHLRTAIAP